MSIVINSGYKDLRDILRVLFFIIIAFLLAALSSSIFSKIKYGENDVEVFEKELIEKTGQLDSIINSKVKPESVSSLSDLKSKGFVVVVYKNDTIYSWSNNEIQFPYIFDSIYFNTPVQFSSNTWYIIKTYKKNSFHFVGIILIKKEYQYENRFLKNTFIWGNFPEDIEIMTEKKDLSFPVNDKEGNYLFSIKTGNVLKFPFLQKYLSPILYFTGFLLILYLLTFVLKLFKDRIQKNWALAGFALIFFAVRFIQTFIRFPDALYQTDLFSPLQFANSDILPSLGDLLLNTIIITFFVVRFNRDFYFVPFKNARRGPVKITYQIALIIFASVFYLYSFHIFESLIINSSISFEAFKITGLSFYSFIGLLIIGLQFTSLVFLIDKTADCCKNIIPIERVIFIFSLILMFVVIIFSLSGFRIDGYSLLFFLLIFTTILVMRYKRESLYNYSIMVVLVFLFSIYSVYFITKTTSLKERQDMVILAETVSTEHDPVAEMLLEDMSKKMNKDTTLANMLFDINITYNEIDRYLQNTYFTGYLSKYNYQFFDCRTGDSVIFEIPEKVSFPCYPFFEDLISKKGMNLPSSDFYYIDNINGRVNYLGKITYKNEAEEISIFIELESKFFSERLGYPELLLNENFKDQSYLSGYSYAKYHKGVLIARYGNFHYSLDRDTYKEKDKYYSFFTFDKFDHLFYNIDNENSVIISKPLTGFFNMLVSFSYIFVFYYLLLITILLLFSISRFNKNFEPNFKNKIQFSIISILLLSLILVGGGTIYFSIQQYQKKNNDNISEKLQSVYVELDQKLAFENELTSDWKSTSYTNLDQLLIRLSDVFYSDINLYTPKGELLATSRPEIIELGLVSNLLDPQAYVELIKRKKAEFIHKESIGKLKYISAYVPFINANNKVLAFVNLPYFTKQDELRKEISNLAVAVINIYVLLILLTVAVAIFISDTISKPLRILQQKFGQIKLLRNHELIEYEGTDEVASLVAEYNRMVMELHRSAELLAKSERESAWREMAKQVAHEIKNPLTPMKLTIQHLQRAWKDKKENYAEIQEKVTRTLIEQIDNLSKIASEFSNFAQMPKSNVTKFNLTESIKDIVGLFSDTANIELKFLSSTKYDVFINADKEQVTRAFINLITNAIQSIPEERKGIISVSLEKIPDKIIVKISDNGKGIPDEFKHKLFVPNFTTKSSGMGMGLAITKNIIEASHGSIRFDTEMGEGTTFIIEFNEMEL